MTTTADRRTTKKPGKPKWQPGEPLAWQAAGGVGSKPKLRDTFLPETKVITQAEAIAFLKRQVFDDAVKAGWLKPCCEKPNRADTETKFYAVSAVQLVQTRMLAGEYPTVEVPRHA